ncbi:MAG TPA: MlaD family protein [Acidobacteriaceae bacterium]|jgi:phospholipid/cholesterol/gamma-HCH transport system substrate-binding protein|nr:MlaD family protein [Acidobacteriaceae bacterium]
MPSQKEVRWSQLKVGLLVTVASLALIALVFLMTGSVGGLFTPKITVRSYFENAAGLEVGAPVSLEGVTVGTVTRIRVVSSPDRRLTPVEVTMRISGRRVEQSLRTDSKASLSTIGVLGDTVVDINSQFASGPLAQDGDELTTMETPNITDVIKSSQGTIEQLNVILAKANALLDSITSGNGSIGKLIASDEFYRKAYAAMSDLQTLTDNMNQGKGTVGKLMTDDTLYNRLNDTAGHLQHVSEEIDSSKGSAGKIINDPELYDNLNQTLAHANSLLADVDAGKGGLGVMAKDPVFAKNLQDTLSHMDDLVTSIQQGKGTLGKLANDDAAYNDLDKLLVDSQQLVTTIRSDPKKYLTIHMKIF